MLEAQQSAAACSLADLEWVDQLADQFEQTWKKALQPPALDAFLSHAEGPRQMVLLHELVRIDLEYRSRRGLPGSFADYAKTYPALLSTRPAFAEEATASSRPESTIPWPHCPRPALRPLPQAVGKYRIVMRLGEGSQAEVFRAVHPELGRDVTVKLGKTLLAEDDRTQLMAEGRLLAAVRHPHLAQVYDCGLHEGFPYLVMEFVEGCSLEERVRQRPLTPAEATALVAQLAQACAVIHRQHIIHQDLKPANILIDSRNQVRLIDFGLARWLSIWGDNGRDEGGGTPAFMAPEQARGAWDQVGPACDIFALGALLYYLLTGQAPFADSTVNRTLDRARRCDFDRAALERRGLSRRLVAICLRAMQADPAQRYQRAEDLAQALQRYQRRPRWRWLAAAVVVLGAVAAWFFFQPQTPHQEPPREQPLVQVLERTVRGQERLITPESLAKLAQVVPLRPHDRLTFACDVPRDWHAAGFCLDTQGQWHVLSMQRVTEGAVQERWRFPVKGVWRVDGPPGTLLVLACAHPRQLPTLDVVKQAFAPTGRQVLPRLPAEAALVINWREVTPLGGEIPRGVEAGTAFTRLWHDLEEVRQRLAERYDYFWGLALPQQ